MYMWSWPFNTVLNMYQNLLNPGFTPSALPIARHVQKRYRHRGHVRQHYYRNITAMYDPDEIDLHAHMLVSILAKLNAP